MFEEMMRYGATLEELCEEAGITVEELLGKNKLPQDFPKLSKRRKENGNFKYAEIRK